MIIRSRTTLWSNPFSLCSSLFIYLRARWCPDNKQFRTFLFLIIGFFSSLGFSVTSLEATTFYVDPMNGDMGNDGSDQTPWRTLQEVFEHELIETQIYETLPPGPNTPFVIKNPGAPVKAGDTILLRSGYHGKVDYYGAYNSDYITIAAQEEHFPEIQKIRLRSVGKWIFRGLKISPELSPYGYETDTLVSVRHHTFGPAENIIIENNNLFSVQDTSTWDQIDWNTLACTGMRIEASDSIVRGNTLTNVNFGVICTGDNTLIEYNRIENLAGDGIIGGADNLVIQYNTIKNFYKVNENHDDGIQFHRGANLDRIPMRDIIIRGNVIISHDPDMNNPLLGSPMGIGGYDGGMYINWLVENNIVLVQHFHGISVYGAIDSRIVNNIAFDPTGDFPAWISVGGITDWKPDVLIEPGVWTHVAFTYDGSTIMMYKDGINVATTSANGSLMLADSSSNEPLFIGQNTVWGEYFDGIIDEVRIYNRALSVSEIAQLYAPPQMVTVPNVVGMTEANAESAITSVSLAVGTISHVYSMIVPAGNIISQDPTAGTSVVINSNVDLVISSGPEMTTVPNVVGMAQANAETAIISASLNIGTISHTYSITVPAGDVVSQNPAAGTSVVTNSAIDIVVSNGPPMITVPSVVGMAQANAETAITSASLTVGTISHTNSTTVPAGDIISQDPAAGTSVVINSAIDLVVSDGPTMVTVPNVVGMIQANAETAITSASLTLGTISRAYSIIVPAGDIISQDPAAGASVVINSAIDLVVSDGPPMVTVPNVVGMAQTNAESTITSASLTINNISHDYSTIVPAGSIISQVPAAGTSVVINSSVQLIVSNGPQLVTVPNVVGMAQAAAESAIISASLTVGTISYAYSTTVPAGDIISHNPAAGTSVIINSAVDLVVSKVIPPELLLYMRLDEGIGTTASDLSGNANNGTLVNGPTWTTGQIDGGLNFDGVNDYVEVPDDPSFDIVDEISVSAWINPADVNAFRTILSKFAYTPAYRKDLYWFLYNGRIGCSLAGPSGGSKDTVVRNNISRSFGLSGENITADHNINIDDYGPEKLFIDYQNHDLRHNVESPAIDAGSDQLVPGTDIEGKLRPFGLGYDIGPYELATLYVSTDSPNEPSSGTPWAPYKSIQEAIYNAQKDYLIRIAGGTYHETIILVDGIYLYGGYNSSYWNAPRNPIANVTIIDGNSPNMDLVSIIDVNVVIDGFTITNTTIPDIGGSGIFCQGSSPTIRNCIISNISSNVDGGGMYNYRSSPTLIKCSFIRNSNSGAGGGMYNYNSNPTLVNCIFTHNHAERGGGGMYNSFSNPSVINCTFFGNSTENFGGGMANGNSSPELTNCIFWGNWDSSSAGMDEFAQIHGGTVSVTFSCIHGWTGALGGIGNIGIDPCFVDADNDDYHLKSQAGRWKLLDYTILDATGDSLINLLDVAAFAQFWQKKGKSIPADLDNSGAVDLPDLALLLDNYLMNYLPGVWVFDDVTSRCIDAGNPGSPLGEELHPIPVDPNEDWGQNLRINIGAYGGTYEASTTPNDWSLLADLTNDGTVNFADLAHWMEYWLTNDNECPGDIDRNGIVDMFDFALLTQDYIEQTIWHEKNH